MGVSTELLTLKRVGKKGNWNWYIWNWYIWCGIEQMEWSGIGKMELTPCMVLTQFDIRQVCQNYDHDVEVDSKYTSSFMFPIKLVMHWCTDPIRNLACFKTGPSHFATASLVVVRWDGHDQIMINLIVHHFVKYEFIISACACMHIYIYIYIYVCVCI